MPTSTGLKKKKKKKQKTFAELHVQVSQLIQPYTLFRPESSLSVSVSLWVCLCVCV